MTIEERAEDIVRSMVSQSWNEEIETVAALLRELELARRVADAAAAADMVFDARCKLDFGGIVESDASDILLRAENAAQLAVESAVREYRNRVEAAAFMAQPGVRRGLEKLDEMEGD